MRLTIDLPEFPADARTQAHKVLEEASELCEAAKRFDAAKCRVCERCGCCEEYPMALDEMADVFQATVNLASALGFEVGEMYEALDRCIDRNEERGRL